MIELDERSRMTMTLLTGVVDVPPSPIDKNEDAAEGSNLQTEPYQSPWTTYCEDLMNVMDIAPVSCFKHAPLSATWHEIAVVPNHFVEVVNPLSSEHELKYWVGEIIAFAGYRFFIKFQRGPEEIRLGLDPSFSWCNFIRSAPRHMGYCAQNKIPLQPIHGFGSSPPCPEKFVDQLYAKLFKKGVKTIKRDHVKDAVEAVGMKNSRFKPGDILEVLDFEDTSRYKLGEVQLIQGDRMKVKYFAKGDEFWYSQYSPYVHPWGWCHQVNAELIHGIDKPKQPPEGWPQVDPSYFGTMPTSFEKDQHLHGIRPGQIFEMRHPVNVDEIVPGYVVEKLEKGYILAGTDWTKDIQEIVLHVTSDYILPINFCRDHNIPMKPPSDAVKVLGKGEGFNWDRYLAKTDRKNAPLNLRSVNRPENLFQVEWKLESVHLVSPRKIRIATVKDVAGHLILIQFDGSEDEQWMSCDSSDLYPAGYSEMMGIPLYGKAEFSNRAE